MDVGRISWAYNRISASILEFCLMKQETVKRVKNYVVLVLVTAVAIAGSYQYVSQYVKVSSNVNGRELPIYSVDTQEKKVALTFDAAWGNEDTQKILDILKNMMSA